MKKRSLSFFFAIFFSQISFGTADLVIDISYLVKTLKITYPIFTATDCNVTEGCAQPGARKLLRFGLRQINIGIKDFELGKVDEKPYFTTTNCHGHPHFNGFAIFDIFDLNCNRKKSGGKGGGCMSDSDFDPDPITGFNRGCPGLGDFDSDDCDEEQGISTGCADVYWPDLDCQYVDITDITDGTYFLRVRVNFDENLINSHSNLQESDYTNNTAFVLIEINNNQLNVRWSGYTIPDNLFNLQSFYISEAVSIDRNGSFIARNTITTANDFYVKPGQNINLIAGSEIILQDGFIAEAGSNFSASLFCPPPANGRTVRNELFDDYNPILAKVDSALKSPQSKTNLIDYSFSVNSRFMSTDQFIIFSLPGKSKINVSVYDITGKKLETILNGYYEYEGFYRQNIYFNSYNSGVYMLRMEAQSTSGEKFSKTEKLVQIR